MTVAAGLIGVPTTVRLHEHWAPHPSSPHRHASRAAGPAPDRRRCWSFRPNHRSRCAPARRWPMAACSTSATGSSRSASGRIERVGPWPANGDAPASVDVRPLLVLPGLVDLHAHLPQLPNAGLGGGLDLLTWLDRYIFPLERAYDRAVAERQAPGRLARVRRGGHDDRGRLCGPVEDSTDAAFAAAEAHGIRAVIGKVMMDRLTYDTEIDPGEILETSLRQSDELATSWHWTRRGAAAVRVHAAVRGRAARRDAARVGGARAPPRGVLADPPLRGRRRDRRGATPVPRGARLPRRVRPRPGRSGRARSSPTPSTSRTRKSAGSSRAARAWRIARRRTCSCRAG